MAGPVPDKWMRLKQAIGVHIGTESREKGTSSYLQLRKIKATIPFREVKRIYDEEDDFNLQE